MTQKMVWYLLIMTLFAGCAFPGQGRPRLCSDYGDRTTIDIVPLLMRSPDYIDRRLSHLDSETTIPKDPTFSGLLSAVIPGSGQIYNNQYLIQTAIMHTPQLTHTTPAG